MVVASLLFAAGCAGETLTDTVDVVADFPWLGPQTPLSVGVVRDGSTVTAYFMNVHSAAGACDVLARANVDDISGATEVVVAFPAGLSAGAHALADVDGSAHVRAVDAQCAVLDDETTADGTVWIADDGSFAGFEFRFATAGQLFGSGMRPAICAPPPAPSGGACVALPICTDATSPSCSELPPSP